jgi:hypothetical protein
MKRDCRWVCPYCKTRDESLEPGKKCSHCGEVLLWWSEESQAWVDVADDDLPF